MNGAEPSDLGEVVERIRSWPITWQLTLAKRIMESAGSSIVAEPPPTRGFSADEVMAMFAPVFSPGDEDCERILEEELIRKYLP